MVAPSRHVLLSRGYRLGGRYKLLYPYAQGGMATIWLCRVRGSHGFEKVYAVKTILPHLASDAMFRNMFLDEARIASRIRHMNVAEIEDLGEDAGFLYMVLEWVPGDPWSKLITAIAASGDPIPTDIMLHIAASTCAGLHAAHELSDLAGDSLNVVHRDVSPQNVLVSEAGAVKVIDFGVAKAIGRLAEQTGAGDVKGKVDYMSPEQATGAPVDRRTDVWALGAVLYEIFAGHPPYVAPNELLVLQRIASGHPPAPLPDTTPAAVAALIRRALEHDPERRFATAHDMQDAIESAMTTEVTPEDVAACVHTYLGPRIEARRVAVAEALGEAAELSRVAKGSELLGWTPGEDAAQTPDAEAEAKTDAAPAPPLSRDSREPAPVSLRAARHPLQPRHKLLLAAASLVTLAIWTHVLFAGRHAGDHLDAVRAAPAPGSEPIGRP